MTSIRLVDADVVIQDADTVLHRATVLIENGAIKQVIAAGRTEAASNGTQTIDCRGLMLLPGLVNSHTHLYQVLMRGLGKDATVREWVQRVTYPRARILSRAQYYDAVLLGCADAIRNGTTGVVDHVTHYCRFFANESCGAINASGLRGAVARAGADMSLVDVGEVRPLDQDIAETSEFLSRWGTAARLKAWVGPAGFHNCSSEALRRFKALADRCNTRFHIHLGESKQGRREAQDAGYPGEISRAAKLGLLDGKTSIAHAIWVNEAEMDLIASARSQVVHCATSNQILASGIADIPLMIKKGISVGLATDGAASNDSQDMFGELKSAALIHRVNALDATAIGAREVFRAATEGGAEVLGAPRLGRLAEDYSADVVAVRLRGNPSLTPCNDPVAALVYQACGRDVCLTMVDGRILYHDGQFTTIDVEDLVNRVSAAVR